MKNQIPSHVVGIAVSSAANPAERSQEGILSITAILRRSKMESMIDRMSKIGEKVENFAQGIREHGKFYIFKVKFRFGFQRRYIGKVVTFEFLKMGTPLFSSILYKDDDVVLVTNVFLV